MYLGLDIGSSSSKVVLLGEAGEILAAQVVNLGTGTKGVHQALEAAYAQAGAGPEEVRYAVVTGYGRMTYQGADKRDHRDQLSRQRGAPSLPGSPHHRGRGRAGYQGHPPQRPGGRGELCHERQVRRRHRPVPGGDGPGAGLPHPIPGPAGAGRGGAGVHQQPVHRVCRV